MRQIHKCRFEVCPVSPEFYFQFRPEGSWWSLRESQGDCEGSMRQGLDLVETGRIYINRLSFPISFQDQFSTQTQNDRPAATSAKPRNGLREPLFITSMKVAIERRQRSFFRLREGELWTLMRASWRRIEESKGHEAYY